MIWSWLVYPHVIANRIEFFFTVYHHIGYHRLARLVNCAIMLKSHSDLFVITSYPKQLSTDWPICKLFIDRFHRLVFCKGHRFVVITDWTRMTWLFLQIRCTRLVRLFRVSSAWFLQRLQTWYLSNHRLSFQPSRGWPRQWWCRELSRDTCRWWYHRVCRRHPANGSS